MVLMANIGRLSDGIILAGTMQEDEQHRRNLIDYQNQAKLLLRKLNQQSPARCTLETGPFLFHYLIDRDICCVVLCEKTYSKRLAFSFLEDIAQEFNTQYGKKVNSAPRSWAFQEFETYILRAKKTYTDSRVKRNLNSLNSELHDVQRIMVQNIDDVLQRGTVLSELDNKAQNLSMLSQKYKKDAAYLNTKSFWLKVTGGVLFVTFVFYFWMKVF